MSFQGEIETRCPAGCEPFAAPVWSLVQGESSPELRELARAGECNLLLCPGCGAAFHPEASWIYYEPSRELLAFVLPESWRGEEARWRSKLGEDFRQFRRALGEEGPAAQEPEVFFGPEGLARLLEKEEWESEEREVMESWAGSLGLSVFRASPSWARERGLPSAWPYRGRSATREAMAAGIKELLAANPALDAWARAGEHLERAPEEPPPPARGARA